MRRTENQGITQEINQDLESGSGSGRRAKQTGKEKGKDRDREDHVKNKKGIMFRIGSTNSSSDTVIGRKCNQGRAIDKKIGVSGTEKAGNLNTEMRDIMSATRIGIEKSTGSMPIIGVDTNILMWATRDS